MVLAMFFLPVERLLYRPALELFCRRAVEHYIQPRIDMLAVDTLQFRKHAPVEHPAADYEQRVGCRLCYFVGVGYHIDWRSVQEYVIVMRFKLADELAESSVLQQFRWVGRYFPGWNDVQSLRDAVFQNYAACLHIHSSRHGVCRHR